MVRPAQRRLPPHEIETTTNRRFPSWAVAFALAAAGGTRRSRRAKTASAEAGAQQISQQRRAAKTAKGQQHGAHQGLLRERTERALPQLLDSTQEQLHLARRLRAIALALG